MAGMSGITIDSSVTQAWEEANAPNSSTGLLHITINDEKTNFSLNQAAASSGSPQADWEKAQSFLVDKQPTYILLKTNTTGTKSWVCIAFSPDLAHVNLKMLYASSREGLKSNLNRANFADDYFITDIEDCTYKDFIEATTGAAPDVRTNEEKDAQQTAYETVPQSVRASVQPTLPINVSPEANSAFQAVAAGSTGFVMFELDPQTETLKVKESGRATIHDLEGKVNTKDPCYILFNWQHTNPDNRSTKAMLFIYYCPDEAPAKSKMLYSTVKQNLVNACEQYGIDVTKKIEASEPSELSQGDISLELYPVKVEKKTFAKPSRPGRRGRGRGRVAKFKSDV